jgi:C4-dicarboxylate-binding protein DctP
MANMEKETGIKMIFVAPHGSFRRLTNNVRPIKTADDMKGLKLRDPNVPAYSIVAKALGATPTPIDFAELYVALDRKVVDGQHNPLSHVIGSKFYEVQKYLSMVPYAIVPHVVGISQNVWKKLTPAQQKAIMEAGAETQKEYPPVALKEEQEYVKELQGKMTITTDKDIDLKSFKKIFREKALPELKAKYDAKAYEVLEDVLSADK